MLISVVVQSAIQRLRRRRLPRLNLPYPQDLEDKNQPTRQDRTSSIVFAILIITFLVGVIFWLVG